MSGWVKLHRSLARHWLAEDLEKLGAWSWLLMMANHADKKVLVGNQLIDCKRGSFITSQRKLQRDWRWSREKLEAFLRLLRADGMVTYRTTRNYTYVSIVNYDTYQDLPRTDTHTDEATTQATISAQPAHEYTTNKNVKNEKNEKKVNATSLADVSVPPVLDNALSREALEVWLAYKRRRRQGYKPDGLQDLLTRLARDGITGSRLAAAVVWSKGQGYAGLFEEKRGGIGGRQQTLMPDGFSQSAHHNADLVRRLRDEEAGAQEANRVSETGSENVIECESETVGEDFIVSGDFGGK